MALYPILFFQLAASLVCVCRAAEISPTEYFIRSASAASFEDCEADSGGYNLCPNSSLLLDSVHGPQVFSTTALDLFYTQLSGRTLFRFSPAVHVEVFQLYYYVVGPSPSITIYSVPENYHPRHNIPEEATSTYFHRDFTSGQFISLCLTLNETFTALLIAPTLNRDTELYISEVNFFSGPVSNEECDGIFSAELPTTEPSAVATTTEQEDTESTTATTNQSQESTAIRTELQTEETTQMTGENTAAKTAAPKESDGLSKGSLAAVIAVVIIAVVMIAIVILVIVVTHIFNKKQGYLEKMRRKRKSNIEKPLVPVQESTSGVESTAPLSGSKGGGNTTDAKA